MPETRLVPRGPFLVDAESDVVYTRHVAATCSSRRATVGYLPNDTPMTYLIHNDEVVFLELPGSPRTWSEHVERKARREQR